VLDVKTGSGAFMRDADAARALARAMVDIGLAAGRQMAAVVSDMSQPLGRAVGHALEVAEALDTLAGYGPPELVEFATELATAIVGLATDGSRGRAEVEDVLHSGRGLKAFRTMIEAQGGDARAFDDRDRLPRARVQHAVTADTDGYLARLDALTVAHASTVLGAARERKRDSIDLSVGIVLDAKIGDRVAQGQRLATLHANDEARARQAENVLRSAITISSERVAPPPLILERISWGEPSA
jgi:pyrimidine-nucleoside phosphorylase